MNGYTSRGELRRLRKERAKLRGQRTLVALLTAGLFGSLAFGGTAAAMASDAPVEGDTGSVVSVVEAPAQEAAPETPVAEQPAPPVVEKTAPEKPTTQSPPASQPATQPEPAAPAQPESAAPQSDKSATSVESNSSGKGGGDPGTTTTSEPKKVFVCKYVGTPGVSERLQTGNNPISVSVNTLKGFPGTFPWEFPDAHGRSMAIAYDIGQPEPSVADCPQPEGPEEPEEPPFSWDWQYAAPTCVGLTVAYPKNIPAGSNNKDVNIRVKDLVSGDVKTFNFHDSDFVTSGKTVTYKVTEHPSWPGWTYYEVQWTQVHGTNYHWEGSVVCGNPPTTPECVQSPTWSYTFDGVSSGTVTATAKGFEQGAKLCDPLAVRAGTYKYDLPASGKPSWPQTKVGANDLLVDTIGSFSYAAPLLGQCRQHDIYAEFVSKGGFDALKMAEKLYGPNNPFEPKFLHQALSGKGPNPTWSTTSSDGCNTPPPAPEPKVEYSDWTDEAWVCGDTEVKQTRTKTTTPYKMALQDGKWKPVVDTANIKVVTEHQTRELTDEEIESCKPETPESKVTYTQWSDQEWACGDETVTQTRTKTVTPWIPVLVSGSIWELQPDTAHAVVTTETQTRALMDEEVASCKPTTPEPKITFTDWEDQERVCGDTEVQQTRTKTTTPYKVVLVSGSTWKVVEDTENVSTTVETQIRALTDEEIESCKPEIPEPKVTFSEWQDEKWICGEESVTQTRTKTTTPWIAVLVSGSTWELQPDTANAVVETESGTREPTDVEKATCPTDEEEPTPPKEEEPTKPAKPVTPVAAQVKTPPTALAQTGADSAALAGLGLGAMALLALGGTLVLRRRPLDQQ